KVETNGDPKATGRRLKRRHHAGRPHRRVLPRLMPHQHLTHESSLRYHGWRVVLACFVMAMLVWGFGFYGHGFYLAELHRLHGWPASLLGSATTAYYLFSALLVIFIDDALRRFGVGTCVLIGAFALAGSAAALPF